MITYILSIFFLFLASVCNSIMDKTSHHFSTSVFSSMGDWWDSVNSWKLKYIDGDSTKGRVKWWFGLNKPVQLTDAWHFFKMLMIIFIGTSIVLMSMNKPIGFNVFDNFWGVIIDFIGQLLLMGVVWNKTFTIFYHTVWSKKT
jgi:hypothetical protein